jgi:ACS family hexuronate transporter-like MFS transporter
MCRVVDTIMRMLMAPAVIFINFPDGGAIDNGKLLSAFPLGYLLTQYVGGFAADVVGPRLVISACMALGAVCLVLSAMATSADQLYWATVLLGMSQGPLFPTGMAYFSKWIPPKERTFAVTMLDTGNTVGSLIALPVSSALAAALGWRSAFWCNAALAAVMALAWHLGSADSPAACTYISAEEEAHLKTVIKEAPPKSAAKAGRSIWRRRKRGGLVGLLQHASVWSIFLAHFVFNYGVYFQNSWSPLYYNEALGMSAAESGLHLTLPHLANLIVKFVFAGRLQQLLSKRLGWQLVSCRRFFTGVGFVGSSAGLALLALLHGLPAGSSGGLSGAARGTLLSSPRARAWATTGCFTFAMASVALHSSGFKTSYLDVTHKRSGTLSGLGNTIASTASFAGPLIVGRLLSGVGAGAGAGGGWVAVFVSVVCLNLLGAAFFAASSTSEYLD